MTDLMSSSVMISSTTDPTSMLNTQLASALSTLGDAQFWEETISPATIRTELSSSDPSNPNSTPTLLKGMKWLLASISKGRDVSDFYPHVVKLVGATNMEVRKMVYMYLVQYADHDATTRELSLLSINSFQRGLADAEQLIRALALRVLSSIRIADILQIQILAVQKCAKDRSPYVRKCAANALSKLAPRCEDEEQKDMLLDIMVEMLNNDTSTMVLSSALTTFCELCPTRLELLHGSFRKICHLLTDMDEWGQVVILDVLSRYCRKFFKEPRGWKNGAAERIDRERRVRRMLTGLAQQGSSVEILLSSHDTGSSQETTLDLTSSSSGPKVVKRRVVQKGFYSDEEDESAEEEMHVAETPLNNTRNILGLPGVTAQHVDKDAEEDMDMDEDHRLLLQSAIPLLKSRNAGVTLGVCSLLYYCGVSSVKTRSAIGKALVRIHRGRREIQYVVLTSIRTLVKECPSAFAPFLNDFFVKALDPPHTRIIKVDILVSLALEPAAIEAVLKELRTYIRSLDKKFVAAAVRAVGRVAELARIVYDRHGQKSGSSLQERQTANRIALDCLYGLAVITQAGDSKLVVGEAVCVMQSILTTLLSDAGNEPGSLQSVEDPNQVQNFALRRILLLLVNNLSTRSKESNKNNDNDEGSDIEEEEPSDLEKVSLELPQHAVASALWIVGDWLTSSYSTLGNVDENTKSKMRFEIVRLLDQSFPEMSLAEKCQAIHFCTKVLLLASSVGSGTPSALCEHVLSMGRIDVHPDVKDQARMESAIIQASIALKHDMDNMDSQPAMGTKLTVETAKRMLLAKKPAPSFLPVEDDIMADKRAFRFGTLSSLVGHQARGAYLPLPPWNEKNSPKALRDPIETVKQQVSGVPPSSTPNGAAPGFYGPDDSSDSSDDSSSNHDSSSSSSDSKSGHKNDADSESDSDSDDDSSSSSDDDSNNMLSPNSNVMGVNRNMVNNPTGNMMSMDLMQQPIGGAVPAQINPMPSSGGDDSSSSDDDSSSSSSDDDYQGDVSSSNIVPSREGNLLSMGGTQPTDAAFAPGLTARGGSSSSAIDDLRGLVMAPIAVDESKVSDPDIERDSSGWTQLVRPEVGGGLSVRARFLRGPTKAREAQLKGLDPKLPNVVCVQVQFGNKKADSKSLRRIRIHPKSGSSSGSFAMKKAMCPPEIAELKSGQMANATLCLQFATASNREGDLVGRFDIKTSTGGGIPIEIKPSVGDLLTTPPTAPSVAEFDASMTRMQGFQRVTSKFQSSALDGVPQILLKSAALSPVGKVGWQDDNKLRLIGGLPASSDLVFVRVDCDRNSGAGTITVCCDHAMAVNSILAILKHAVS